MNYRKFVSSICGVAAAVAVSVLSNNAHALQTTCTVSQVAWATGGSGTMQIVCGGTFFYAFGSSSTCPVIDIEARKQWMSLAESAALTGRSLYIEYSSCSGGPGLTYVRLQ